MDLPDSNISDTTQYSEGQSWRQTVIYRYAFAIAWTTGATWSRCLLSPYLDDRAPFGTFFLSILASAWVGGTGPAVVALVLGSVAAAHFVIPPEESLAITNLPDVFSLIVYFVVGVISIALFSTLARRTHGAELQSLENQRLSAELQRASRRKDEFLAVLAHELRNPLTAVKSGVTLLCRLSGGEAEAVSTSVMIDRQIRHLSSLVNDLMDVSRYIRDEIELCLEELPLCDVAQDSIQAASEELSRRKQRFTAAMPDTSVIVRADRVRLTQIIANLLANAAKYTHDGGNVELRMVVQENQLTIEVQDDGIGIAPEFQSRVFELFSQLEPVTTRRQNGLGLGLAIVQTLTNLHGGTVSVFSRGQGHGSLFIVQLPIVVSTEPFLESLADASQQSSGERVAANTRGLVYIIDDNVDAAETMATLIRMDGFQVHCFYDGPSGIHAIEQSAPGWLFLDIGLPGMDGYEVARRVRELPSGLAVKIIACTGWGSQSDIERSQLAGIDLHLVKPIDPDALLQWLVDPIATAEV